MKEEKQKVESRKRKAESGLRSPADFRSQISNLKSQISDFRFQICFLLFFLPGCAAYQFGADSLFPRHIQTVYVPMFQSSSFRRDLAERLTEAVTKEIEAQTPYKVVADPNADSVLKGQILGDAKHPTMVDSNTNDSREIEVALTVKVTWTDRAGNVLRDCKPLPADQGSVEIKGTSNLVPEMGQSTATAQQEAINRIAKQVVSLMEAPW